LGRPEQAIELPTALELLRGVELSELDFIFFENPDAKYFTPQKISRAKIFRERKNIAE